MMVMMPRSMVDGRRCKYLAKHFFLKLSVNRCHTPAAGMR